MDYQNDKITLGNLRKRFYDRRKELELLDDTIGQALTERAVPVTIISSAFTYKLIRDGYLKNNGLFGLMRKNLVCMAIGVGASLIGIRNEYHDKLAIFYTSHRYQEIRDIIQNKWKEKEYGSNETFTKPNHLNLDFERPHFEGLDAFYHSIEKLHKNNEFKNYVTYEELQRKNREKYAIKHTMYS